MVGETPPQDRSGEPVRGRRAAPDPEDTGADEGGQDVTPRPAGRRSRSEAGPPAAEAAVPADDPAPTESSSPVEETQPQGSAPRSRAGREARAAVAASAAGPAETGPRQDRERERLRATRDRLRAESDPTRGATAADGLVPGTTPTDPDDTDPDDTGTHTPISGRRKAPKLVIAVAAALVLVLGVVFTVMALRGDDTPAAGRGAPTSSATPETSALLSSRTMLSPAQAKEIDPDRSWKVALDQTGRDDSSPSAACVASEPVDGQPQPEQLLLRTLTATTGPSTDKAAATEAVLHQAQAYATPEQAIQAYTLIVKSFGDCVMAGTYISSGATASGVGDQLATLTFTTVGKTDQYRTVAVNRTGRVVNVLDVAKDGSRVSATRVVEALGKPTDRQCTAAIGLCTSIVDVGSGPPPSGGDQPGFLAAADIPPAGSDQQPEAVGDGQWAGLEVGVPAPQNSGCEAVDFSATPAKARVARTYLWSETPAKSAFGLDENVLTLATPKAATALADKVTKNVRDCKKRQLTATTSGIEKISGVGADQTKITGYVADVAQKTGDATLGYRVAIVSTGRKVVYLFLPTEPKLDITDAQWKTLAIRAGQRATQIQ